MRKTIVIAEVGECWNGDKDHAKKLIKIAAKAGCDYVKFQTLDLDTMREDDPEKEWFLKVALSEEMIGFIVYEAAKNKILPLFTPANVEKAKMLKERFKFQEIKIASSVAHDKETIKYCSGNFKTVFLSTGMSSFSEIKKMVDHFKGRRVNLYLLHCISEYPTGPLLDKKGLASLSEHDVHLNMMLILKERFPACRIGYSDHTQSLLACICAVAAGAEVIEKHITLDRKAPLEAYESGRGYLGTDHVLSLEPGELIDMVRQIRRVEKIFGERKWVRTEGEKMLKDFLVGRF